MAGEIIQYACRFIWKLISKRYVYDDEGFIRHKSLARIWVYAYSDHLDTNLMNFFGDLKDYPYIHLYYHNNSLYCDVRGPKGIKIEYYDMDRLRVRFGYVESRFTLYNCTKLHSLIGSPIAVVDKATQGNIKGFFVEFCRNVITMEYAPKNCYNLNIFRYDESVRDFELSIKSYFQKRGEKRYAFVDEEKKEANFKSAVRFSKWLEYSPNKVKSLHYLATEHEDVYSSLIENKLIDAIEFSEGELQPDFIRIANIELNSNHRL